MICMFRGFNHSNQMHPGDFLPSLRLIHLGSVPSAPTTPASAPRVPIPRQSHPAESLRSRPVRRRWPPKAASAGGPARPCDHS